MSVIHAYTEPNCTMPAYVNLAERDPGLFILTVRSSGAQDSQAISLTRAQLLDLVNDACEYLDGPPPKQAEKVAQALASSQGNSAASSLTMIEPDAQQIRVQCLHMALQTQGTYGHHDVLAAAKAYQAHITAT